MRKKYKKKIQIKINKKFKENMSEIPEKKANEPKGEDFAWTKENDISLKRKYISFPLDNWKKLSRSSKHSFSRRYF